MSARVQKDEFEMQFKHSYAVCQDDYCRSMFRVVYVEEGVGSLYLMSKSKRCMVTVELDEDGEILPELECCEDPFFITNQGLIDNENGDAKRD